MPVATAARSVAPPTSPTATVREALDSLDARLGTATGRAVTRLRALAEAHPDAILAAIRAAERRGWKSTARTLLNTRGLRIGAGTRPAVVQGGVSPATASG